MTGLTAENKAFLDRRNIPLSVVFDASGLQPAEYRPIMKALDKWVAVGVKPCAKRGHTIRTRRGHCMRCGTPHFYLLRFINPGQVYIAASEEGRFLKIGTSTESVNRIKSLNFNGYAGVSDWKLISCFSAEKAGEIEHKAQTMIGKYAVARSFIKDGRRVDCLETFRCRYGRARSALLKSLGNSPTEIFRDEKLETLFESLEEETGQFVRKKSTKVELSGKLDKLDTFTHLAEEYQIQRDVVISTADLINPSTFIDNFSKEDIKKLHFELDKKGMKKVNIKI